MHPVRIAYIHGFSSNPSSSKATSLRARLEPHGLTLHVPDLNVPTFPTLRISAMLDVLDAMDVATPGAPWILVASSLGGYLSTLWASLHPARVQRLVLLAPAFDVPARWRARHGDDGMAAWRAHGTLPMNDADGVSQPFHYGFYVDACTLPPWPTPPCPTLVFHGTRDDTVPVATSERFARENHNVTLRTLDDDHLLYTAIDAVADDVIAHAQRA
jgi:hypothetical protein